MAAGDAHRAWFPDMVQHLRRCWRDDLPTSDLVRLRDELDEMLGRIRAMRRTANPIVTCPTCGYIDRSAEPHVSVRALGELRVHFDRWDRGEITAFELNDLVHRFHQDTSREIWRRYATTHLEPAVACAVAAGVLRTDELPVELVQHLARLIELYEQDVSAAEPRSPTRA